jgi:hypothetical protein
MLINLKNSYFYLYQDRVTYRSIFTNGAIILPTGANNSYIPINIKYTIDNKSLK